MGLKRKQMLTAGRGLSLGERAWVCTAIAVFISTGYDVRHAPNAKVRTRNEIVDALESVGSSARDTEDARLVFGAWLRARKEWLTHEHAAAYAAGERFAHQKRGRADWADARRACVDLICILCPEAGEYLLTAEERQRQEQEALHRAVQEHFPGTEPPTRR